ncbi:Sucrase/ferredoxin-like-domain-containing protein [Mycena albidolilacea]|uniref:Sucrase/ferredoxin-like-domain-containing protein n=1 Tax=Mycena albidolilacea TaxID=1033008 RepID=A0AAD7AID8_9AGAR|nr:Sucrase/ferredoxin-like-domain-containing protein [Mycena albidolilacea]
MSGLRKLKAWVLNHELNPDHIREQLGASGVPVSTADCRTCADPCEDGHGEYPPRFTVDMETQMLGSVRPFCRQIMVSTGITDWDRDIARTSGSLTSYIDRALQKIATSPSTKNSDVPRLPGIFNASDSTEIAILNGSHKTISDDPELETVLVFPDFVVISGIPSTARGAELLWKSALHPRIPRILGSTPDESPFNTWVLPYSAVITLCSHKRRDNRCGISAPKLERVFTDSLHRRGWTVDTQIEHIVDSPLEKFAGTTEEKDAHVVHTLKRLQTAKKALILFNSHMGGHRYAGNCIIYTPNGTAVWYGRVSPHEVESVVENTVEGGLVLPPLLRGGLGLSKPGCKTLHDW